jgi:hypothetical protein
MKRFFRPHRFGDVYKETDGDASFTKEENRD